MKFKRRDTTLGVIHHEEQGVGKQGMVLSATSSSVMLSAQCSVFNDGADLQAFADALASAWTDHLALKKMKAKGQPAPGSTH